MRITICGLPSMTNERNIRVVVNLDGNTVLRLEPEVGRTSEKAPAAHYSLLELTKRRHSHDHDCAKKNKIPKKKDATCKLRVSLIFILVLVLVIITIVRATNVTDNTFLSDPNISKISKKYSANLRPWLLIAQKKIGLYLMRQILPDGFWKVYDNVKNLWFAKRSCRVTIRLPSNIMMV